jgi:hypothetical protein
MYAYVVFMLNRQYKKVEFKKRPLLHQFFLVGLSCWLIYIFLDIFMYSFAAVSFDPTIDIVAYGYDVAHPSLLIINILRDVAIFCCCIMSWCYVFVPYCIRDGELKVKKLLETTKIKYGVILFALFLAAVEWIVVKVESETIIITENYDGLGILFFLCVILLYNLAAFKMVKTFRNIIKPDDSEAFKNKIKNLMIGLSLMGFGYLWALFWNIVAMSNPSLFEPVPFLLISYGIHIPWILSPYFINKGFSLKDPEILKEIFKE